MRIKLEERGREEERVAEEVARCLVTALLIEASAHPKPGLVDRVNPLREASLLNFEASSVAFFKWFREAALLGAERRLRGGRLGLCFYGAAKTMVRVQSGGNTHLGALLLLTPMAAAAGFLRDPRRWRSVSDLRRALAKVVLSMDWRDTLFIMKAIASVSPGGLGRVPYLDAMSEDTYLEIRTKRAKLRDVLRIYRGRDLVADEIVDGFPLTFEVCLPKLTSWLNETRSLERACVNALLEIMAIRPDTHIARRRGLAAARMVSGMARRVLKAGGAANSAGVKLLMELDGYMRRNDLRPGASADILDAALAAHLLRGYRI